MIGMDNYYSFQLRTDGVVVVPMLDQSELHRVHTAFHEYLLSIPEYKRGFCETRGKERKVHDRRVNAGGFAALNCASAFHAPVFREIDTLVYDRLYPILLDVARAPGGVNTNLECIPDRVLFRTKGDTPSSEVVHRDLSRGLLPTDSCFGSMVNLNLHQDQTLSMERGSHLTDNAGSGFTKITDPAEIAAFKSAQTNTVVPPGHVALFYESIKHEVRAVRCPYDLCRKFLGFRLTTSGSMLYPENHQRFLDQAPLVHKGGDIAPMYPRIYTRNHPELLARFGEQRFDNPRMFTRPGVDRGLESAAHACADCQAQSCTVFWHARVWASPTGVLKRECPSLRELGILYPPYTDDELAKFSPRMLRVGGTQ
jgi:hypothetical protein